MTHDPLCEVLEDAGFMVAYFGPAGSSDDMGCLSCDLIARIRAEEQQQVAIRLTAYHAEGCIGGVSNLGCGCGLWNDVVTYSVELP